LQNFNMSDKDKAIEHYEKFPGLWKDADPGIPEGCEEEGGWAARIALMLDIQAYFYKN